MAVEAVGRFWIIFQPREIIRLVSSDDDRMAEASGRRSLHISCTFLMLGIGGIAGGMSSVVSRICRRRHLQADLDREEMHEFLVFSLYHREVE